MRESTRQRIESLFFPLLPVAFLAYGHYRDLWSIALPFAILTSSLVSGYCYCVISLLQYRKEMLDKKDQLIRELESQLYDGDGRDGTTPEEFKG